MSKFKEDMSKFTIGDEVQISDGSIYKSQAYKDGEKMRGVITDHSRITWHIVTWENGRINSYQDDDLEPYSKAKGQSDDIEFGGLGYDHFDLLSKVIDKQAILEEAKRLYPIGTQYRPLDGKGNPYTSCGVSAWGCKWVKNPDGSLIGIDCGIGYVYVDGKWANIHTGIMTAPEFVKVAAASLYGSIGTPSPIEKALPDLQSPIMVPKSTSRSKIKVL
jgi:hypothetical protein